MDSAGEFEGTDRFVIQRRLGAGGMGVVYEALDRDRNSVVALKTLRHGDASSLYRFKQEFRALVDISHPNLASLHELVSAGSQWFFTMELVDGVDFLAWVRKTPQRHAADTLAASPAAIAQDDSSARGAPARVPTTRSGTASESEVNYDRLRQSTRQLAEGVDALHAAGKLHRDIKPSNVMVTRSGRVVLLDFGLVTEVAHDPAKSPTTRDNLVGTAGYMSPEQGASLPISAASDWYAVGVMLYEALTGQLPFDGPPLQVLMDKQRKEPTPPIDLVPETPEDLNQLCAQLLRTAPSNRPDAGAILRLLGSKASRTSSVSIPSRSPQYHFFGRDEQLGTLRAASDAARAGRPVVVTVSGASGMGKSALIERFARELTEQTRAVVLSGRCFQSESVPYKALDNLVDSLSRYLGQLERGDAESLMPRDPLAIARLFPVLRRIDAVADAPRRPGGTDPHELRRRATSALRELLARIADRRPLILVVDDLQWGDADSASLLADLLRAPDAPPLTLIVTYREEDALTSDALGQFFEAIGAQSRHLHRVDIEVGALSRDEAVALALGQLGSEDSAARALAAAIAGEAAGNPLFVDELVRYVQAGADRLGDEPTRPGQDRASVESVASITLDDAIMARINQLPIDARLLLEVVAVAARPMPQSIAMRAAGLESTDNAISVLRAGHLVRTTGSRGSDIIENFHDRIREVVAKGLSSNARADRHRRLAVTMDRAGHADPEALANHFRGAGNLARAIDLTTTAAEQASAALAFERAAALYRIALEELPLLGEEATPERLRSLRERLGDALWNAGRLAEAAGEYLLAAEGASAAHSLDLRRRAVEQLLRSGHVEKGLQVLQSVLEAVGMSLAKSPRRALWALVMRRARVRLRGVGYTERDSSQIAPELLTRIDTCWSVAGSLGTIDTIRGADFQTHHLLLALDAGEPFRVARAFAIEAMYLALSGRKTVARTRARIDDTREIATRIKSRPAFALSLLAEGLTHYQLGEWKRAFELFEEASRILRDECTGMYYEIAVARRLGNDALFNLGEIAELRRRVPVWLNEAQRRGDLSSATDMRCGLSNLAWLAADDPEQARAQAIRGLESWEHLPFFMPHYSCAVAIAHADLYASDGEAAYARMMRIWPYLESSFLLRVKALEVEAWHLRARAAVAASRTNTDALDDARRCIKRVAAMEVPGAAGMAGTIRGLVAHAEGNTTAAVQYLTEATAQLEQAGLGLMAACARFRAGQLAATDAGTALMTEAETWMKSHGVDNPAVIADIFAPLPNRN